jgi:hypothetical protein
MANDIGSVSSINGSSMALNTQRGDGAQKPSAKGNHDPGKTKPDMAPQAPVPMPK